MEKHENGDIEYAKELIRIGVPREIVILNIICPAGDTYVDDKGVLRRKSEYDDGSRYWEHPKGRRIKT